MDLYAAGFNAWNQLSFEPPSEDNTEPEDLSTFTKVLGDEHLERPRAGLYYTLVRGSSKNFCAGKSLDARDDEQLQQTYQVTRAANGMTLCFDTQQASAKHRDEKPGGPNQHTLTLYPTNDDFLSKSNSTSWPCQSQVCEVASFDAGFLVLYQDGRVATLGDPRYQDCLARDTSKVPADQPGQVPDLMDLGDPIKHVTAGGYCLAALTESGSLYVWGQRSAGDKRTRHIAFAEVSRMPNYFRVDEDKDVQDVAFGDGHAIALTTDGDIYVIGRNSNGQLGLEQDFGVEAKTWTKVELDIPRDSDVVGVAAGPRASFILTSRGKQET